MIRDPDHPSDSLPLVGAEAILLHDALDEFLDGEFAEEDGPVVDFGFGGTDVDAQRWFREKREKSARVFQRRWDKTGGRGGCLIPGDRLGEGVLARW